MSVRDLEDFIHLIETAERISVNTRTAANPDAFSKTEARVPGGGGRSSSVSPVRPANSLPQHHPNPMVPRLALPSWTTGSSPPRFVGPPQSHCGLTLSDSQSSYRTELSTSSRRPDSGRSSKASDLPIATVRKSSFSSDRPSTAVPKSSQAASEASHAQAVRRGSQSGESSSAIGRFSGGQRRGSQQSLLPEPPSPADIIQNIQKNSPFCRKLSKEVLPATNTRFSAQSTPQSSPESKRRRPPQSEDDNKEESSNRRRRPPRPISSSPSPIREPPKPLEHTSSHSYSSSFSSGSPQQSRKNSSQEDSPLRSNRKSGSSSGRSAVKRSSSAKSSSTKSPISSPSQNSKDSSTVRKSSGRDHESKQSGNGSRKTGLRPESARSGGTLSERSNLKPTDSARSSARLESNNSAASDRRSSWASRNSKRSVDEKDDISESSNADELPDDGKQRPGSVAFVGNPRDDPHKTAVTSMRKYRRRPMSAPNKRPPVPPPDPPAPLGLYSKSLRLVGVDVPSTRKEATKLSNQPVVVETKEPTLKTRIMERSNSFVNLNEKVKKDMKQSEFDQVKSDLSRAVFEEWYFRKFMEAKELKHKKNLEEEAKLLQEEEKKKDLEERSKEEFQRWLENKKKQQEKEKKLAKAKEGVKESQHQKQIDPELIEKKTKEWRERKKKEWIKQKKLREQKEEEEKKQKLRQKEEVEKHYIAWKEAKMKELKDQVEKEKEKLVKLKEDKIEKRKDAEAAFQGWKNKKKELEKEERMKEKKKEKQEETAKVMVDENDNKLEEAKQAYDAWLADVEEREEKLMEEEEERKKMLMWRPPWYPAGRPQCHL